MFRKHAILLVLCAATAGCDENDSGSNVTVRRPARVAFWDWSYEEWKVFAKDRDIEIRIDQPGEFFGGDKRNSCVGLTVGFTDGRTTYVYVRCPSIENGDPAGVDAVLAIWQDIEPELVPLFREVVGGKGYVQLPAKRYGDSEFLYQWSANNKAFVEWIGPESRRTEMVRQSRQIAEFVLCWDEHLEFKRKEAEALVTGRNPNFGKVAELLFNLYSTFEMLRVERMEPSTLECFAPSAPSYIPAEWPECTKIHLMAAAGRMKDACLRHSMSLRGRKGLRDKPFEELLVILGDDGMDAASCMYGDLASLEDHESASEYPVGLRERWSNLGIRRVAAALNRNKEWE